MRTDMVEAALKTNGCDVESVVCNPETMTYPIRVRTKSGLNVSVNLADLALHRLDDFSCELRDAASRVDFLVGRVPKVVQPKVVQPKVVQPKEQFPIYLPDELSWDERFPFIAKVVNYLYWKLRNV